MIGHVSLSGNRGGRRKYTLSRLPRRGVNLSESALTQDNLSNRTFTPHWEIDNTEGSFKNLAVCLSFWRQEYLAIPDNELHKIGNSVRNNQIAAILLIIGGAITCLAK
jgi:hypothetical protein